ncbi:FCD domain-containing protein [Conexibacter sp. JD483]|uniref:FadR/GntR family transcriptional regulator n=1 Tax=unclassified Conexibacter TaxID=2627773 RepID=UPI002721A8E7|nr:MULTISPECIES: FCD domain-containing protein [unclassified Conexibacter]MDO8189549.1 FCD domain-containing protein [Conexibacter sp. CPCC 205706]MDO8202109.1 FCD domain-containing protein [Conexibacter sp. CPCC 205762]MDR9372917.1 FCD domain-containing protein [Conexibacter sp. JD483]
MARLHRELFETIAAEIVAGDRQAGEMLPKEIDLAARFDVSRGTVREAIRALQERGLVDVKHGRGAIVLAEDRWDVFNPDVLAAALRSERGLDLVVSYLESRRLLEVPAARLAAGRAAQRDRKALAEAHEMMAEYASRRSPRPDELFHQADQQFHQTLVRSTGNPALARLIERIHSALFAAQLSPLTIQERFSRAMVEHGAILTAVVAGDTDRAANAMERHLQSVADDLSKARARQATRSPQP